MVTFGHRQRVLTRQRCPDVTYGRDVRLLVLLLVVFNGDQPEPLLPGSSEVRWAGVLVATGTLLIALVMLTAVVVTLVRRRRRRAGLGPDDEPL